MDGWKAEPRGVEALQGPGVASVGSAAPVMVELRTFEVTKYAEVPATYSKRVFHEKNTP